LDVIYENYGCEVLKKIIEIEMPSNSGAFQDECDRTVPSIFYSQLSSKNLLKILDALKKYLIGDVEFIRKILMQKSVIQPSWPDPKLLNNRTFLQEIFDFDKIKNRSPSEIFDSFFNILKILKEMAGILKNRNELKIIEDLILGVDDYGNSLLHYMALLKFANEEIRRFLLWVKEVLGIDSLKKFIELKNIRNNLFWNELFLTQRFENLDLKILKSVMIENLNFIEDEFSTEIDSLPEHESDQLDEILEKHKLLQKFRETFPFRQKLIAFIEMPYENAFLWHIKDYLSFLFLSENFDDENVVEMAVEILQIRQFEIIHDLLNVKVFLDQIESDQSLEHFGNSLKKLDHHRRSILNSTLKFKTYIQSYFLKSILYVAKNDETAQNLLVDSNELFFRNLIFNYFQPFDDPYLSNFKEKLENFQTILSQDQLKKFFCLESENGFMFFHYFWCKMFEFEIKNYLESSFEVEFLKNMMQTKDSKGNTILFYIGSSPGNFRFLTDYLVKNFDLNFIQEFFMHKNHDGEIFFHYCGKYAIFHEVLNFMRCKFDKATLHKILTIRDREGDTLMTNQSKEFLRCMDSTADAISMQHLNLLEEYFYLELPKEFIFHRNNNGRNFLFLVKLPLVLAGILEFIKRNYEKSFLIEQLTIQDNDGNTVLFTLMEGNMPGSLKVLERFLDKESLKNFLTVKNINNENFLYSIKKKEVLEDVAEFIVTNFDSEFLKELLLQSNNDQAPPFLYFIQFYECFDIFEKYFGEEPLKHMLLQVNQELENS
jgi:hypothetical protein